LSSLSEELIVILTTHYLVVAKIRERLAVSNQPANKMDMDRFNLKKLNQGNVKEQYEVTIKNRFSALENLKDNGDINTTWDAVRENIKISAKVCITHCEAKHHKPWIDEESLKLVDRSKQDKLQWLQDPSIVNEDSLNNVRWEASRHFRNKKRVYMKDKINELESETCIVHDAPQRLQHYRPW
jgi:hypothetical protein